MSNYFRNFVVVFSIISIVFIFCFSLRTSKMEEIAVPESYWNQDISIVLENGIYRLELQTIILDDTLMERWIEYGFLSPLICSQYLVFYKNCEMINKYELPTGKNTKIIQGQKQVSLVSIPVFEICLLKGKSIDVYKVYGANYCFGISCPEFIGLYSMEGEMITENITAKKYFRGEDMANYLIRCKIEINNPVICNSIFNIFTTEE